MSSSMEFDKGLRYFDLGKWEQGEKCLKNAIEMAEKEKNNNVLVPAYCCYGEYLADVGRSIEAKYYIERVLEIIKQTKNDDVFEYEYNTAKEILNQLNQ